MKTAASRAFMSAVVMTLLVVCVVVGFHREYVAVPDGLVGLRAFQRAPGIVALSGSLYASGAKIEKLTIQRDGLSLLIRVYCQPITSRDSARDARGSFNVALPVAATETSLLVGDSPRWMTIGRFFGCPVRLPRIFSRPSACRTVWRRAKLSRSSADHKPERYVRYSYREEVTYAYNEYRRLAILPRPNTLTVNLAYDTVWWHR